MTVDGRTKTRYEWSQEMRRIETAIRQQKDTATLARETGDDKLRMQCQGTILQLNRKYGELAGKAGLTPEYQRTYVQGFRDASEKALTSTSSGGTIAQSPTFSVGSVSKEHYDPEEYRSALQSRFDQGDDLARALYNRFVPEGGAVSDGNYTGIPEYRRETNEIRMSFLNDAWNVAGAGTTWFHEHGHYIDAALGNPSHRDSFINAIIGDCRTYESRIRKEQRLNSTEETRFQVSANMVLQGVNTFGVQDIFGGSIGKPYPGAIARHEKVEYWDIYGRKGLGREAFAHMFEACFDGGKASVMKYYLPTAWGEFRSILKEMAE